ncbi:ATP-binding protein [Streptomyces noboritoensis]|uniref:ATP-binding protein n=1 Tax=Streptomyces noboritoensis TaxID=67337 RepID=A0ABV6TEI6_9ACTN
MTELLRELAALGHEPPPGIAPLSDAPVPVGVVCSRFRLHEAVAGHLAGAAATGPLLVLLDDLHRADEETLALLGHLAERADGTPLMIVAAYRTAEADAALRDLLGRLARHHPALDRARRPRRRRRGRTGPARRARGRRRDRARRHRTDGGQPVLRPRDRPADGRPGRLPPVTPQERE